MKHHSLFEQITDMTKAHAYDIVAKECARLKAVNKTLVDTLEEFPLPYASYPAEAPDHYAKRVEEWYGKRAIPACDAARKGAL